MIRSPWKTVILTAPASRKSASRRAPNRAKRSVGAVQIYQAEPLGRSLEEPNPGSPTSGSARSRSNTREPSSPPSLAAAANAVFAGGSASGAADWSAPRVRTTTDVEAARAFQALAVK